MSLPHSELAEVSRMVFWLSHRKINSSQNIFITLLSGFQEQSHHDPPHTV